MNAPIATLLNDRQLVTRMLAADERAFDVFVEEYHPRLYRFASRRLAGDPEAAADVVQATFEKVLPRLGTYRGEAALFTWMCTFCRFEIAAYWRAAGRRRPEVELAEDTPDVRAALESLAAAVERQDMTLERRELARLVRVVLDHLPLPYARALELKYLEEISVRELAGRIGVTPKAAESLLTRARGAFRDAFAEVYGGSTT
ncbi:MAG: RNA polymerase sigma factor [Acidobacteriota bacterium]